MQHLEAHQSSAKDAEGGSPRVSSAVSKGEHMASLSNTKRLQDQRHHPKHNPTALRAAKKRMRRQRAQDAHDNKRYEQLCPLNGIYPTMSKCNKTTICLYNRVQTSCMHLSAIQARGWHPYKVMSSQMHCQCKQETYHKTTISWRQASKQCSRETPHSRCVQVKRARVAPQACST